MLREGWATVRVYWELCWPNRSLLPPGPSAEARLVYGKGRSHAVARPAQHKKLEVSILQPKVREGIPTLYSEVL